MLKTLEGKGHQSAVSKTVIKQLRTRFYSAVTISEDKIPNIWPKKGKVVSFKLKSGDDRKSQHIVIDKQIHFIHVEHHIVPTLKIVHQYPDLYPKFIADQGALKFILKGANVMSPGLTNQNAHMDDVQQDAIVAIYVQGHDHALAIGITTKSSTQIKQTNQGVAVNTIHFIGDGFWNLLYKEN